MSIDLHTQQVEYAVEIVIVEEIDLQQPFRMLAVGVGDATGETDRASEMAVKRLNERADIRFGQVWRTFLGLGYRLLHPGNALLKIAHGKRTLRALSGKKRTVALPFD